jgi:hypothetical protein
MMALPYGFPMRQILLLASACTLLSLPALAATKAGGPVSLGQFGEWTAAQYGSASAPICYAFSRAKGSAKTPSAGMILVTERPTSRDEVVVNAPSSYPAKSEVALQIDKQAVVSLYTAGHSAYARDGRAVVIGMQRGSGATASWAAKGGKATQSFSLSGFSAAYGAIVKACPSK